MKYLVSQRNIITVLVIAVMFRLIGINQSFWLDEAAQAIESSRPLSQQFNIIPDFQPPLFHLIVHAFTYVSLEEWWLRLASVIPGLITIYVTYLIGKQWVSKRVGLVSALFLATSQYHLFYSQELRPYSLAAMWGTLSSYAVLQLLKRPSDKKWWIWFAFFSIGGVYSMYVYPALLMVQLLLLLHQLPMQKTRIVQATIAIVVAFLPWLPTFLKQFQAGMSLTTIVPGWGQVVSLPAFKSLPLTAGKFLMGRIPIDMHIDSLSLLILIGIIAMMASVPLVIKKKSYPLILLAVGPILVAFMVSFWVPVLEPKRVLFCLPLVYVLLAWGIHRFQQPRWLMLGVLLVNTMAVFRYATEVDLQREPWREAIAEVTQSAESIDYYLFAFPEPFAPWEWYANKQIATLTPGVLRVEPDTNLDARFESLLMAEQVVVFDYLMDLTDPDRRIYDWLYLRGFVETGVWHYPNMGFVRVFSRDTYAATDGYLFNLATPLHAHVK